MKRVINGKLYNTDTADPIADNTFRDGSNRMNCGRCTTLYKTGLGKFFAYNETCWQGEHTNIEPLTIAEAKEMFENYGGNADDYEDIFGEIPIDTDQPDPITKRLRQVRDALNKCKNQDVIEQVGKILNV